MSLIGNGELGGVIYFVKQSEEEGQDEEQPYALARDRARREIRPPARYGYDDFAYCLARRFVIR